MRDELIEDTLVYLLRNEPFFSSFFRSFRKEREENIPTAGVNVQSGQPVLYYNPTFFENLTPIHRVGLLKHEAYHIIFEHCSSRKRDPHLIWNYATDLAINSMIDKKELPEGGLIPGMPIPKEISKMNSPVAKNYKHVFELINKFPKNENSEWYFERLLQEAESDFKKIQEHENALAAESQGGGCEDGGNSGKGDGSGKGKGFGPMDDHNGWGEISDEAKEKINDAVKAALSKAVKESDDSPRGWGTVSSATRQKIREIIVKKINWKEILNYFVGTTQRGEKSRTHKKINRKYPYIHPGIKRSYKSSIAIYIDQSGSVGDDEIELFFGALRELTKETEFIVYHFDTAVDEKSRTKWAKNQKFEAHRTRCGGTCFKAVSKHFDKVKDEFDGYIIMTDGYAPKPPPAIKKRCWMICPNGEIPSWVESVDTAIKMNPN